MEWPHSSNASRGGGGGHLCELHGVGVVVVVVSSSNRVPLGLGDAQLLLEALACGLVVFAQGPLNLPLGGVPWPGATRARAQA